MERPSHSGWPGPTPSGAWATSSARTYGVVTTLLPAVADVLREICAPALMEKALAAMKMRVNSQRCSRWVDMTQGRSAPAAPWFRACDCARGRLPAGQGPRRRSALACHSRAGVLADAVVVGVAAFG